MDRSSTVKETYRVSASARVPASAARTYAVLADYQVGHPAILPPGKFLDLHVERGGTGTGTVARARMKVFGQVKAFRFEVLEPEPGRVLVERDVDTGAVTSFTVEPEGADACMVTITTDLPMRAGLAGRLEKVMAVPYLRGVYREELDRLGAYAARGAAG